MGINPLETITINNEIIRKGIHLFALTIPAGYLILTRKIMLIVLAILILTALGVEIGRFKWHTFSHHFYHFLGDLLRKHEWSSLTGSTYLLLGSFLTILFFNKPVAIVALFFLVVSDAFGAVVGRVWGKHFFYRDKTIEGCVAFLLTAVIVVFIFLRSNFIVGLAGVAVAFFIDVFVKGIDDNLTIPLGAGLVMQILFWVLR